MIAKARSALALFKRKYLKSYVTYKRLQNPIIEYPLTYALLQEQESNFQRLIGEITSYSY